MMTLDRARPGVAAQALGLAQGALEWAIRYTSERQQFGQSVMSFQAIQFMLSDMAIQVEAARQLVYTAARAIDAGFSGVSKLAAMCKVFATDTAMRVTTDAVQLFGGYGYCQDYPIEKYMRDAKITQIYEGTNQIQRVVIGRALTREADQIAGHLSVKVEHFPEGVRQAAPAPEAASWNSLPARGGGTGGESPAGGRTGPPATRAKVEHFPKE